MSLGATLNLPQHRARRLTRPKTWREQAERGKPLGPREWEAAMLVSEGMQYKAVAAHMGLTEGTIKTMMCWVFLKTGTKNKTELARLIWEQGHKPFGTLPEINDEPRMGAFE